MAALCIAALGIIAVTLLRGGLAETDEEFQVGYIVLYDNTYNVCPFNWCETRFTQPYVGFF